MESFKNIRQGDSIHSDEFSRMIDQQSKSNKSSVSQEDAQFIQFRAKIANSVDILFFLDCTRTMQRHIDVVQKNLKQIIQDLKTQFNQFNFRIGVVGYRDFDCQNNQEYKMLEIKDFTNDIDESYNFLSGLKEYGGDDIAENVIGALERGLYLDYQSNCLVCFFIADAPSHGTQYHDLPQKFDFRYDQIPENTLEDLMQQYQKKAKKVFFYCMKLENRTDKMYQIMKNNIENLEIRDATNSFELEKILQESIQQSVVASILQGTFKKIDAEEEPPMDGNGSIYSATFYQVKVPKLPENIKDINEEFIEKLYDKARVVEFKVRIKILDDQIGQGTFSNTFQIHDLKRKQKLIGKLLKNDLNEYTNIEDIENRVKNNVYSQFFAQYYRWINIEKQVKAPPIFFLPAGYYKLDKPFNGVNSIYAELDLQYVQNFGQYQKYMNNLMYCDSQTMASFSHFSYVTSYQQLLIVDLQGVGYILTDPSIHSENYEQFKDKGNHGKMGFNYFFLTQHQQCSHICQQLNLHKLRINQENQVQQNQISQTVHNYKFNEIYILCSLCEEIQLYDSYEYYAEFIKRFRGRIWCQKCENQEEITAVCKNNQCKDKYFKYAPRYFIKLGMQPPQYCLNCKDNKKIKCSNCPNILDVKTQLYNKITYMGKKPFYCKNCLENQRQFQLKCTYDNHNVQVNEEEFKKFQNKGRYMCKGCYKKIENQTKNCQQCDRKIQIFYQYQQNKPLTPDYCEECEQILNFLQIKNVMIEEQKDMNVNNITSDDIKSFEQIKQYKEYLVNKDLSILKIWYFKMEQIMIQLQQSYYVNCKKCNQKNYQTKYNNIMKNNGRPYDFHFYCKNNKPNQKRGRQYSKNKQNNQNNNQ